jgi:hypothetical protein
MVLLLKIYLLLGALTRVIKVVRAELLIKESLSYWLVWHKSPGICGFACSCCL